jgi:uncharacterized protein YdiU (UPF0061 family)
MKIAFDNSYARLPERMYARVKPTPVRAPKLVAVNRGLAETLGIDPTELASTEGVAVLAGNAIAEGSDPIALAYAGHQFGSFVPQLGDGRAILLGEVVGTDGKRRDIQLKGAGRTPFSRGGDGRAALGPVLREYLVSEAMAALGIPTTRALGAVLTGEPVHRERVLPGAIIARVASSHLRVGTFEYFAVRDDKEALTALVRHALERHHPDDTDSENGAIALLERVLEAQAELVAKWIGVGFVHGVMNTDNSSISGETLDYGPCAFLDTYHPAKVFSSIDRGGRYAFMNQPNMALWNLTRLAEALLPLFSEDEDKAVQMAQETLQRFSSCFDTAHARVLRAKLGFSQEGADDIVLARDLLERMAENDVDHTLFFRRLSEAAQSADADAGVASLFQDPSAFHTWAESWRKRLAEETTSNEARASAMRLVNPAFIPRNHRVEEVIEAATERKDFGPFETLKSVLAKPFEDQPEYARFMEGPGSSQSTYRTFCGT